MIEHLFPHPSEVPSMDASWMIQCDFDGTISVLDVTDSLLERFGRPGWQDLENAWARGEIGSRTCMQGQAALLDMNEDELNAHLDGIAIDPGFAAFAQTARGLDLPLQIVSDGMDRVIGHVLRRHGLGHLPVVANRLLQTGPRSWQLQSPYARAGCRCGGGTCKCAQLELQRNRYGKVLFVGDGSSDFCVSGLADFVFAKNRLIEHCSRNGYPHAAFSDFRQARGLLLDLVAHERLVA